MGPVTLSTPLRAPPALRAARPRARRRAAAPPPAAYKPNASSPPSRLADRAMDYVRLLNARDVDGLAAALSPGVVYSDRVWSSEDKVGPRAVAERHARMLAAYPDLRIHADAILAAPDSNMVALHWQASGGCAPDAVTGAGPRGVECTGQRSVLSGVTLLAFDADERLAEIIEYRQPTAEERAAHCGMDGF